MQKHNGHVVHSSGRSAVIIDASVETVPRTISAPAARNVGTLDLARMDQLIAIDISDGQREPCHEGRGYCSSEGNQKIPVAKNFSELSERDQTYILRGAVVVCAFCCFLAYVYIDWKKHKNPHK